MSNPSADQALELKQRMGNDLLFCLEYLAKLHGFAYSRRALTEALPLGKEGLNPILFLRALKRIQLAGEIFQKPLVELTKEFLPCIVLLKSGQAWYVEKRTPKGFWVVNEQNPEGKTVSSKELNALYEGHCILLKPATPEESQTFHDHWLWGTLYKMRSLYSRVLWAAFFTNVLSMLIPLYAMNVYDRVISHNSFDTLWVLSIGIMAVLVFDFILKVLKSHFVDVATKNADIVLSSSLFERILGLDLTKKKFTVGSLSSHVRELETIREFCSSLTLLTFVEVPFAVMFLMIITWIGGEWYLVISLLMIAFIILTGWIMQKVVSHYVFPSFGVTVQKSSFMVESIVGMETIRAFGAQGEKQADWEIMNHRSAALSQYANFFSSIALNLGQFFGSLNYIVFIIVGVYLIAEHQLTMGGLIGCSILGSRALQPFITASALLLRLNQAIMAYKAINTLMNHDEERGKNQRYFTKPTLTGNITFNKVAFSYPNQEVPALKEVSLTLNPKDKLVIMGRMGSGKTTLQKLLLGFYKPLTGEILLDGLDSRQIDPADIRSQIGYVSQDIYLFSGTILENIILGHRRNFNPEQVEKALVLSGAIHFIRNHPKGLNMQVGEGGNLLSGGQRQTIGIARAILQDYPILVFDEPTTMMDQGSEQWFLNNFKTYAQDKTVIIISHNPTMLSISNKMLILEAGEVRYFGDSQEFIKVVSSATTTAVKNLGVEAQKEEK